MLSFHLTQAGHFREQVGATGDVLGADEPRGRRGRRTMTAPGLRHRDFGLRPLGDIIVAGIASRDEDGRRASAAALAVDDRDDRLADVDVVERLDLRVERDVAVALASAASSWSWLDSDAPLEEASVGTA